MDDIYDNLENYNDTNVIEEIKNENKALKVKLEEYSKEMAKLQKDFDKVNKEYKNLEKNYSSLLKTARAEIERKTETIKKLNSEKDMFVIQAMQKTGRNILNSTRTNQYHSQENKVKIVKSNDTVGKKKNYNKEKSTENNCDSDKRLDLNRTPSADSVSTVRVDKSICSDKDAKSFDSDESNKNKNLFKDSHNSNTTQNRKMNFERRKSTASKGIREPKSSSEEHGERIYVDNKRRSPPRNNSKYDTRDYRTTKPYDSGALEEPYRINPHRHSANDKFRNVEQYDSHQRHRRRNSPERSHHRYHKEYDNYQLRGEYSNQKVLRSPSPKYNQYKRNSRFNDEDYRDFDKYSNRFDDHSSMKQQMRNECDEPNSKRLKLDSYSKSTTENIAHNKDSEKFEKTNILPRNIESSSCQSPDYISVDTNTQHFVKEIKTTVDPTLEDPRESSKKYRLKTCNNITSIATDGGQNIDFKCVDKSLWDIKIVDVPKSLTKQPPELESDNLLKEIYMDIDDVDLKAPFDSGEMHNDDDLATFYAKEVDEDYVNEIKDEHKSKVCETSKEKNNGTPSGKAVTLKLKIPKIIKPAEDDIRKDNNSTDTSISRKSLEIPKDSKKKSSSKYCNISVENSSVQKKHNFLIQNIEQNCISDKVNNNKYDKNVIENFAIDKADIETKRRKEMICTINEDLQLSDEESDVDLHENIAHNLSEKEPKALLNIDKASTDSGSLKENKSNASKHNKKCTKVEKTKSSSSKRASKKEKDSSNEITKKHKNKRKSAEHTHKTDTQQKEDNLKKLGKNECKESISKQPTSKLNDLFGDNSSLITPDDLEMDNVQEHLVKHSLTFDNTQDAMDINIEDIKNKPSKEVNTFETVLSDLNNKNIDNTNQFSVNVTVANGNDEVNPEGECIIVNSQSESEKQETTEQSFAKTVIISSGVQPELGTTKGDFTSLPTTDDILVKKCPLNSIKACATSTPHKNIETSLVQSDTASTMNINNTMEVSMTNVSDTSNLNNTNGQSTADEIPDIRIFIRRKRKIIKKVT